MKKSERKLLNELLAKDRAEGGTAGRPIDLPAGDDRREAMKRSADSLAEEGERRADETGGARIDPTKLKVDYEIVQQMGAIEVSDKDPECEYCWVRFKAENGVPLVDQKLSLSVRINGYTVPTWQTVNGDMKEAAELKGVDGTRRIGDVLLMRCRKDIFQAIQKYEDEKRKKAQMGAVAEFLDFANTAGMRRYGARVMSEANMSDRTMQLAAGRAGVTEQQIRQGTIPGAEIGR